MASPDEIRLGRLAVKRGLVTEEQVLALLRQRNAAPQGPDLGVLLVQRGHVGPQALADLQRAAEAGEGTQAPSRHEASTDHEISLGSAREAIARASLDEAVEALRRGERAEATKELRRLTTDFRDTESGNKAREVLDSLGEP